MTDFRSVAPEYFKSMLIPVRDGRDVSWSDTATTAPVVIVSETAARTFWPGQRAIGRRLKRGRPESPEPWLTVVGVVGDVRQLELLAKPRPAMYFPATQDPGTGDTIRDWGSERTYSRGAEGRVERRPDPAHYPRADDVGVEVSGDGSPAVHTPAGQPVCGAGIAARGDRTLWCDRL